MVVFLSCKKKLLFFLQLCPKEIWQQKLQKKNSLSSEQQQVCPCKKPPASSRPKRKLISIPTIIHFQARKCHVSFREEFFYFTYQAIKSYRRTQDNRETYQSNPSNPASKIRSLKKFQPSTTSLNLAVDLIWWFFFGVLVGGEYGCWTKNRGGQISPQTSICS